MGSPELRVQVTPQRFRVPDITVVHGTEPEGDYLVAPPFLCIEILSEGDTLDSIQERVDDYVAMGVANVWVLNPRTKRAWAARERALVPVLDGVLRTTDPEIVVSLAKMFAE